MLKITIGQPSKGSIDFRHQQALDGLIKAFEQHPDIDSFVLSRIYGCSLLEHARSAIATAAYQNDCDILLWIDDDMVFEPSQVVAMCLDADRLGAVVAAVASTKAVGGQLNTKFSPGTHTVDFFECGSLLPIETIGTGIMAVASSVLHSVATALTDKYGAVTDNGGMPIVPFHKTIIYQGLTWGEDTSFCLRARRAGHRIFADTRVRALHIGTHLYGLEETTRNTVRHQSLRLIVDPTARAAADKADKAQPPTGTQANTTPQPNP